MKFGIRSEQKKTIDVQADILITQGRADAAKRLYDGAGDLFNPDELANRMARLSLEQCEFSNSARLVNSI